MNEKSAGSTLREKTIRHTSEGWGERRMRLVFLQRGNQTNWIWSTAEPLGRACCLLRQCDTADSGHRHNKSLIRQQQGHGKKLLFEFTFGKREAHIVYLYKHQHKPPNSPLYQWDAALLWSVTLMLLPNCFQILLSVCKELGYLKSTRQIKIVRRAQAQTDKWTHTRAEPLCAVVLTTEQEQRPGLWVWMENEAWEGVNRKKAVCKPPLNPSSTHKNWCYNVCGIFNNFFSCRQRQHEAMETGYFASKLFIQPIMLSTLISPRLPFSRMLNEHCTKKFSIILHCRNIPNMNLESKKRAWVSVK